LKLEQKQEVLEMFDIRARIERLLTQLEAEIDILQVEKRIRGRVKRQMEKSQREYYLNEQVKAIQKELGEGEDGADMEDLEKKVKLAGMGKEGLAKAQSELSKLKLMSPMSAEATVVRNFIETLIGCRGAKGRAPARIWRQRERYSTPITGALKRSRNGSSSISRCSSASTASRRRFCAWLGLPASARRRSGSR
jgi:ATP-dependent Lon protease